MDDPVFDAFLKTALEEALRRDAAEGPEISVPSRRQRKRMRALLAEPCSSAAEAAEPETAGKPRNPVRWLSVVIIAALLTGAAAAGLALGGGELFREIFEKRQWVADHDGYGEAVDTEQVLDMGAEMGAALAESDGLRFELLDAIFDGQTAFLAVRMTVLDEALLAAAREENAMAHIGHIEISTEGSGEAWQGAHWSSPPVDGEGESLLEISFAAGEDGERYLVRLEDFVRVPLEGGGNGEILRRGEWTLSVTVRPAEVLRLEPGTVFHFQGTDWVVDSASLSPLTLKLEVRCLSGEGDGSPCKDLKLRLKNGEIMNLQDYPGNHGGKSVELRFRVPLDLEQVEALAICGVEIPFCE